MNNWKQGFLSCGLTCAMLLGMVPTALATGDTVLCAHHPQHTAECGYSEEVPETVCGHQHTEDCFAETAQCIHEHTTDCFPAGSQDDPAECTHTCSEESRCITKTLNCTHTEHDSTCGYQPAKEGSPCGYSCVICQIEEKIAALPDELTNENRASVQSQLNEIMALYETLEEEEKNQIDMTRCTELQAQTGPANTASTGMTVYIKTLTRKQLIPIQIEPTDSIKDLKEKIQDETGIPISEQVLIFGNRELEDKNTLQDYSIQKDSKIYAAQKIPYLDKNGEQQIAVVKDRIEEYTQTLGLEGATTWYVVYVDVAAQNRLEVLGNVHLILMDGNDLNAPNGISVEEENTLTIYGQSTGGTMGTLTATSTGMHAAIGGGDSTTGTITINGGTINAHAADGAGIG